MIKPCEKGDSPKIRRESDMVDIVESPPPKREPEIMEEDDFFR